MEGGTDPVSVSQDLVEILQKIRTQPSEYAEYYAYCEEYKAFVKGKKCFV